MAEIVLDNQKFEVQANAMTMLIYEDEFKGSSFLNDFEKIENPLINQSSNIKFSIAIQMIWACLKTANDNITAFHDWKNHLKNISMNEIYAANVTVAVTISKNMASPSKNTEATAENSQSTTSEPQN